MDTDGDVLLLLEEQGGGLDELTARTAEDFLGGDKEEVGERVNENEVEEKVNENDIEEKYFTASLLELDELHGGTLETELQSFQVHNKL